MPYIKSPSGRLYKSLVVKYAKFIEAYPLEQPNAPTAYKPFDGNESSADIVVISPSNEKF